jgi:DNA-binding beta-propeller fold protein YncE
MDIRVRAQVAGAFPGVFLSNKKLYSLTKSGLVVYNLSGKNAVLAQTVNLRSAVNPRDVVQSLNGQEMYVANYGSNAILAYNVPTSTAKNVVAPLKYIKCQLQSCRPTSLSVDPTTGDLLIVCSDDKKVAKCSSSGQVQTLPLPASASRLIHSTWLAGRKFASLVQIQSRYAICIGNADGTGSSSCQYTVQQAAPRYLIATPDNTITVVDQATNDALFVYGPGTETGLKLPLNARLLSPTSIRVDYINGQMAIISPQSVTVFDVQVKVTY